MKTIPWNKGLTKETDTRVRKMTENRIQWNKGLTKETDERVKKMSESHKGRTVWNIGLTKETDERVRKIAESHITWDKDSKTKKCYKCHVVKPLTEFSKNVHKLGGLSSRCKDCSKKYYQKHRKQFNEYNKKYYRSHKEEWRVWTKKYIKEHKEEWRVLTKKSDASRRARLRSCEINDVTSDQIRDLLNEAFLCAICSRPFNNNGRKKTIDHIFPLSKGGNNTLSNLQIACKRCNSKKGNRLPA